MVEVRAFEKILEALCVIKTIRAARIFSAQLPSKGVDSNIASISIFVCMSFFQYFRVLYLYPTNLV